MRQDGDGVLWFAGRLKRFVKLGGEMVSLPAVEEALLARFGREDDDEVALAVEATPVEASPELVLFTVRDIPREAANGAIRDAGLSPIHNIRLVRRLDRIPVLGTGKTDYRAPEGPAPASRVDGRVVACPPDGFIPRGGGRSGRASRRGAQAKPQVMRGPAGCPSFPRV